MPRIHAVSQPNVVDADLVSLQNAAHDYESALVAGDVAAATAWFDIVADDPDALTDRADGAVSRFGPNGEQFGASAVAEARAAQAAVGAPLWLHESIISLAPDAGVHLAVLRRGDAIVQRTQVWVRRSDGWRIRHAHVSSRAENVE